MRHMLFSTFAILASVLPASIVSAQEDIAEIKHEDIKLDKEGRKHYFLIGDVKKVPKDGFKLLVMLPGGDGGADFLNFVKRIYKNALDENWLVAELVSLKWKDDQEIVWPSKASPVEDMGFTTAEFLEAVVADVKKRARLAPKSIVAFGWSSSGPALYEYAREKKIVIDAFYISMAVFKAKQLGSLAATKGRRIWIEHSREDKTCPFALAEEARNSLTKAGAVVEFTEFEGGHGWSGPVYQRMKSGIEWLLSDKPPKKRDGEKKE